MHHPWSIPSTCVRTVRALTALVAVATAAKAEAVEQPPPCTGAVTIGDGASRIETGVTDRAIGAGCLDALIIDTAAEGANYGSHAEFMLHLTRRLAEFTSRRALAGREAARIVAAGARSDVGKAIQVRVLAFNDFHGNLQSPGTFGNQAGGPGTTVIQGHAAGGVDYLAGYVTAGKAGHPNNVVVSAGDLIGASPLISALFHDEGTIEAMNRLGLDFNAVGNHEFDEGVGELLRMQHGGCHPTDLNSCQGAQVGTPVPFEGARFEFLSANVVETASGRTLFPAYGVKAFPAGSRGKKTRVAFIGLTLEETPSIVTPNGVAGLAFRDEADTVNGLVRDLRRQGVAAVVVLLHQGGFQGPNTSPAGQPANSWINDCAAALQDPSTSPIKGIVSRLEEGVDLVVSGHTHVGYNCRLPDKTGRLVPVTQAAGLGRVLTAIDLTLDTRTGRVVDVTANNVTVDRNDATITPDAPIAQIVSRYAALVTPLANRVVGAITTDLPSAGDEMPAGDLIADAQLAATRPAELGAAQVAFMNRGGVRNPGFVHAQQSGTEQPGEITYGEIFTVQPFGNSLVTLTVTAQQLKDFLEQQFLGCAIAGEPTQTQDRILQVSSGFRFSWSASAAPCNKIRAVSMGGADIVVDGALVVPTTTSYRITINSFMSSGGDGFTVLTHGTSPLGGAQDIDALVAYLSGFRSPNPPYDPEAPSLGKPRITKLP